MRRLRRLAFHLSFATQAYAAASIHAFQAGMLVRYETEVQR